MSIADLRITEVHYNPADGTPPFIEVTNTGSESVSAGDFFIGNSDFIPEYFDVIGPNATLAPSIPAGATMVLVPSYATAGEVFIPPIPISQEEFEAAYGPLPEGAIYYNFPAFFLSEFVGGATYTIGSNPGIDELPIYADSVFIPDGAAAGQSVSVSLEDGSTSIGDPTPGSTGSVAPPPPPSGETIEGTGDGDVLVGTDGDDDISGGDGSDDIRGGAGNDSIDGGAQSDLLNGGAGDDDIFGGTGNDSIVGGAGADEIYGGSNNDRISGGADNDVIYGDHGRDNLSGGTGDDSLFGGASHDVLNGDDGNDYLDGGRGNDILRGGAGNDVLDGGRQSDTMNGGDGDDILLGGIGNDRMTGGAGADTFVFVGAVNADTISDFETGIDQIDISSYGPMSGADVLAMASQSGSNVLIDMGSNGQVTLRNTDLGDLSLDDFIYIPDDIFVVG